MDNNRLVLGARIRYQLDLANFKITPQLTAAWHHEFMNDNNDASTSFVNAPAVGNFNVDSRDPERDYGLLGANVNVVIPGVEMMTFFVGYNAHSFNGGMKVSF